ncbi:dienelactone hydrolase family protein [Nocardioides panaciterrulae]|uniref:Carboxymethylenebutenolidase n=1 Tax=Nocardioides panaciterrulae TaxID=661492 RepID=A0A7Y9E4X5_9ACTN|nr:dienelactone hydrolase family protein [Nocardioides panaciterrulae]NYD40921.1 carboxymethylenebutenolidase [Nocardioides panaciterrulae]
MGETIEIKTDDGVAEAYLTRPEGDAGPRPGVLFFIDAIGLRPRIMEMADRIASWGYVVLAPNVFYRDGSAAELAPPGDLTIAENRERFFATGGVMERVQAYTPDRSDPDTLRWIETLLEHARAPLGVTGYCMGARLATRAAGLRPDLVAAVGGFHGGGLVVDGPDSPHLMVAGARAEFAYGHADGDHSMPVEAVEQLGKALEAAGLSHTNEIYEGAQHGYTMADTAAYHAAAAERHFETLQGLFERTL